MVETTKDLFKFLLFSLSIIAIPVLFLITSTLFVYGPVMLENGGTNVLSKTGWFLLLFPSILSFIILEAHIRNKDSKSDFLGFKLIIGACLLNWCFYLVMLLIRSL